MTYYYANTTGTSYSYPRSATYTSPSSDMSDFRRWIHEEGDWDFSAPSGSIPIAVEDEVIASAKVEVELTE
jgi:hypothetical protein